MNYLLVRVNGKTWAVIRLYTLGNADSVHISILVSVPSYGDSRMNTQKFLNMALEGVDAVGYRLDQMGITGKLNRHNIAAFLMAEQKHLEGEWDSLQVRMNLRRSQFEQVTQQIETRAAELIAPALSQVNRFRQSH